MKGFKIRTELNSAKNEKDVENIYRRYFLNALDGNVMIESPYGCDGYLKSIEEQGRLFEVESITFSKNNKEKLKILFEFKYDEKLEEKLKRAPIILQTIYYLKKFELDGRDGRDFPNVVFVGDKDQCFFIHTNMLQKYLDKNLDWSIAPSQASTVNPDLILEIMEDETLEVHTITVTDNNFKEEIIKNVLELNSNVKPQIRITQHNISRIFEEFVNVILKDKYLKNKEPEKIVGIFIGCIVLPDEYYRHPTKKNILITPDSEFKEIQINGDNYKAFYNYFNIKNYTIEEKRKFTETQDRLIEELSRRKNGEYFTPTNWVDEAVKMLDYNLGDDWREKYVVWDCACGTKNLTRDYSFSRLYSSTLILDDLKVTKNYNKKNISFQYDFLNDDINLIDGTLEKEEIKNSLFKIPKELLEDLLQNKPLLFFINPPYGTANADGAKGDGSKKKGMSLTKVNELMKKEKIGASSQQLYAQFLFKILKLKEIFGLTNINIATFANPLYMSGSAFKKFREKFLKNFKYKEAMIFRASHFADVKGDWGISFAIWESGETIDKENFIHKVKDIDKDKNGEIYQIETKNIYNTDFSISLSDWMQGELLAKYKKQNQDYPQMTSPLNIKQVGVGSLFPKSLGYFNTIANNIYQSESGVGIFSSAYSAGHGYSIQPEYFENIISGFVARRLGFSLENWTNQKDEFLAPNINHKKYKQYLNDSLILSVFNPKAKVSSLRNVEYKGKNWDILNEFFFMSIEQVKELALEYDNEEIFNDIIEFPRERFLYLKIKEANLSPEATEVYNVAIELVKKSFKFRKILAHDSPEYNLNTWDAGWYQIKYILEKYFKDEYKEFDKKYKMIFNNWREFLYELEFLKK